MDKILIVEDEIRMRILIKDYFKKEGFQILEASNGKDGLEVFKNNLVDLVILDVMMPLMDGFTLCKNIREVSDVPIILLTAKSEEEDKLLGYELGTDDYVTKPFSPKVLVAKAKALLKRSQNSSSSSDHIITIDNLTINKLSHEVSLNDELINLTPKEFDLLIFLSENRDISLSRENILDKVWGYDYDGDIRTVDTTVKRLREKLLNSSYLISTVRGSGYKLGGKNEKESY